MKRMLGFKQTNKKESRKGVLNVLVNQSAMGQWRTEYDAGRNGKLVKIDGVSQREGGLDTAIIEGSYGVTKTKMVIFIGFDI